MFHSLFIKSDIFVLIAILAASWPGVDANDTYKYSGRGHRQAPVATANNDSPRTVPEAEASMQLHEGLAIEPQTTHVGVRAVVKKAKNADEDNNLVHDGEGVRRATLRQTGWTDRMVRTQVSPAGAIRDVRTHGSDELEAKTTAAQRETTPIKLNSAKLSHAHGSGTKGSSRMTVRTDAGGDVHSFVEQARPKSHHMIFASVVIILIGVCLLAYAVINAYFVAQRPVSAPGGASGHHTSVEDDSSAQQHPLNAALTALTSTATAWQDSFLTPSEGKDDPRSSAHGHHHHSPRSSPHGHHHHQDDHSHGRMATIQPGKTSTTSVGSAAMPQASTASATRTRYNMPAAAAPTQDGGVVVKTGSQVWQSTKDRPRSKNMSAIPMRNQDSNAGNSSRAPMAPQLSKTSKHGSVIAGTSTGASSNRTKYQVAAPASQRQQGSDDGSSDPKEKAQGATNTVGSKKSDRSASPPPQKVSIVGGPLRTMSSRVKKEQQAGQGTDDESPATTVQQEQSAAAGSAAEAAPEILAANNAQGASC